MTHVWYPCKAQLLLNINLWRLTEWAQLNCSWMLTWKTTRAAHSHLAHFKAPSPRNNWPACNGSSLCTWLCLLLLCKAKSTAAFKGHEARSTHTPRGAIVLVRYVKASLAPTGDNGPNTHREEPKMEQVWGCELWFWGSTALDWFTFPGVLILKLIIQ